MGICTRRNWKGETAAIRRCVAERQGALRQAMGRGLFVGCLSSTGVLPRPETFDDMRVLDVLDVHPCRHFFIVMRYGKW